MNTLQVQDENLEETTCYRENAHQLVQNAC